MRTEIIHTNTGNVLAQHFDSIADLTDYSAKACEDAPFFNQRQHGRLNGEVVRGMKKMTNAKWFGLDEGSEGVREKTAQGWADGVQKMIKAMRDMDAPAQPKSAKRRRTRGDFGDSVDMGAVWAGNLSQAWARTAKREIHTSQNITIYTALGASWKVPASALFWRGAAALKLADVLTQAGYNVRIIGTRHSYKAFEEGEQTPCTNIAQFVTIKESSAPLDLNSLASSLCLSGFNRLYFFQAQCKAPFEATGNLGYPVTSEYLGMGELEGIDGLDDVLSKDLANDWVRQKIEAIQA